MLYFDFDDTIVFNNANDLVLSSLFVLNQNEKPLYASLEVPDLFHALMEQGCDCVVVTARKYENIKNDLLIKKLKIKHYICSLGFEIYYNNKLDNNWLSFSQACDSNLEHEKVKEFLSYYSYLIENIKVISNGYIYVSLSSSLDDKNLRDFSQAIGSCGYILKAYPNKLKIYSGKINKGEAVKYFNEQYNFDRQKTYGMGNDLLDLDFLKLCNKAFVPKNSYLDSLNIFPSSSSEGVLSAVDNLKKIYFDVLNEKKEA